MLLREIGNGSNEMSAVKPLLICLVAAVAASPMASANDDRVSPIRKAAIERMQAKLGDLRGSISPQDSIIMLTNRLLDMQKPVRQSSQIRGSRGYDTVTTGSTRLSIDDDGPFREVTRKSVHNGFSTAAGHVPAGPDEDHYTSAIDDHGL